MQQCLADLHDKELRFAHEAGAVPVVEELVDVLHVDGLTVGGVHYTVLPVTEEVMSELDPHNCVNVILPENHDHRHVGLSVHLVTAELGDHLGE